jgi:hypothetical protein
MISVRCVESSHTLHLLFREGWIRTTGHYYSQEAIEAKKLVFPTDYDVTTMFWLINEDGVYSARSGLLPLVKEIFRRIFKLVEEKDQNNYNVVCM